MGGIEIRVDDLKSGEVIRLLEEHLADMYATSPPESVHALDVEALKAPEITFFSGWENGKLLGCVALKELDTTHAELKSMRTSQNARRSGVASVLLQHVLEVSVQRMYQRISLETGVEDYFRPAHRLYEKFGFEPCEPFVGYQPDPNSLFMTRKLPDLSVVSSA